MAGRVDVLDAIGPGGYWPTETQELLLRAALLSGDEALDAWRACRSRVDVEAPDRASRRLLPLLGANLRRLGVDDPVLPRLDDVRREAAAKNRRIFDAGRRVLTVLADAGIATLVLKGGALVGLGHVELDLRPMSDLDVVVPTAQARTALDVLERAGWAPRRPVTAVFIAMQHAINLFEAGAGTKCDLHWHAYWECCGPSADDDLWAASVPLDFEGVATRALGPADQLLHLCVHGSRRARRPHLQWIPDALQVLRAGGVDWTRFLDQARKRRVVLRTATMVGYLGRRFAAPVPDEARARLRTLAVSPMERVEYWAGNHPQSFVGELPSYWCHYRRLRETGQFASPLGFARYLQRTWKMESLGAVARGALGRAALRVRVSLLGRQSM